MAWTWIYQNDDGSPSQALVPEAVLTSFPSQSDAETYIGQTWQALLEGGITTVTLYEDDHQAYGPMPLKPAE